MIAFALTIFILILMSMAVGFYLGLRSQREAVSVDATRLWRDVSSTVKKLKPKDKAGIIKTWTPERFELERQRKFEEENY